MKGKLPLIMLLIGALLATFVAEANAVAVKKVAALGPGSRIHGIDISRWQHPGNKPIDFKKMYKAGIRFVLIKGSDALDAADATALKYLKIDRTAAQAAGLYTGFYHYATLPDSVDPAFIVADANAQAQKIVWRLATIGGYSSKDLPVTLDLENNCVRKDPAGNCQKYMNKKYVTLWAQSWLASVALKTGRPPIVYSYPQFLENAMVRSADFVQYPLWIAHYNINPASSSAQPGVKNVGCYSHSWTTSDCGTQWQIWQYTSCGIGAKYGVPTDRVDLDVFAGSSTDFLALTAGIWIPTRFDFLPVDEPTTMHVISTVSKTTTDVVQIVVDVLRPSGSPVVTGTVNFTSLDSLMTNGIQKAVRSASGRWTLNISRLQAGHYLGLINYIDQTGTHANNAIPVNFDLLPAPSPSATPTPSVTLTPTITPAPTATKSPTAKPSPVDVCAGQIRN